MGPFRQDSIEEEKLSFVNEKLGSHQGNLNTIRNQELENTGTSDPLWATATSPSKIGLAAKNL